MLTSKDPAQVTSKLNDCGAVASTRVKIAEDFFSSFAGSPGGIATGTSGEVWVSDLLTSTIWLVDINPSASLHDKTNTPIRLETDTPTPLTPSAIAVDASGTIYVADGTSHRILALSSYGSVSVLSGGEAGYRDGAVEQAVLRNPIGLALGHDGAINVADTGNNAIRKIDRDRRVSTIAGGPSCGYRDGIGDQIALWLPTGIAADSTGQIWVADHGNRAIRRIIEGGDSETLLTFTGRCWPVAVAPRSDGTILVAAACLHDIRHPMACVFALAYLD